LYADFIAITRLLSGIAFLLAAHMEMNRVSTAEIVFYLICAALLLLGVPYLAAGIISLPSR
jgi:hypothetical protein